MDKIERDLADLKEEIENAKKEGARAEGQKEQILKSLEKEIDTTDIKKAEKMVKKLIEENKELEEEIEKKYQELKEKYEW